MCIHYVNCSFVLYRSPCERVMEQNHIRFIEECLIVLINSLYKTSIGSICLMTRNMYLISIITLFWLKLLYFTFLLVLVKKNLNQAYKSMPYSFQSFCKTWRLGFSSYLWSCQKDVYYIICICITFITAFLL